MTDASGKLVNFNYDLVNEQVKFNNITLSEPTGSSNDIVVTNASNTTIDGRNISIVGSDDPKAFQGFRHGHHFHEWPGERR